MNTPVHSGQAPANAPLGEGSAPRYVHDCDRCRFLGRFESDYRHEDPHVFDLYVCPATFGHTTVVARFSDSGSDYYSGIEFARPYTDLAGEQHDGIPMLVEARRRAIALGHLGVEPSASGALHDGASTVSPASNEQSQVDKTTS
jgi:hypothetical protein